MGSVVISVDAELGWGFHDLPDPPRDRVESGRRGWKMLRSLFEEFDIPATWAVVGHLFLDDCDGTHAGHPAPPGWFQRERGAWADRPDLRFGPDLIAKLLDSSVDHELASHSFSHVLFDSPAVTPEIARAECLRSIELGREWDQQLRSFVYPRNEVGHRDALAETGFQVYRGRTPYPEGPRRVLDVVARDRTQLVQPRIDDYGLVNVPASTFIFGLEGWLRSIAETIWADPVVAQLRRGIDEAARGDGVFHIWLHPNNLVTQRDDERLRASLAYLDQRRAETNLTVETMGQVGRRVLSDADGTAPQTLVTK